MANLLTPAQYAAHRGVQLNAVAYAIQRKRISVENGLIDQEAADASWNANETKARPGPKPETPSYQTVEARTLMLARAEKEKMYTERERTLIQLRKLEYDRKLGLLVTKESVEKAAFTEFRNLRDAILNIPDRLAGVLAVETDEAAVYQILRAELEQALRSYAQGKTEEAA
jgi:hypothetical protein